MAKKFEVRVTNSVDGLGESIDQISDDSFFTYGWFKTLESFGRLPNSHYLVADYEDTTVGIAPCFIDEINDFFDWGPNIVPFLRRALNFGQRLGIFNRNVLLCYSPACFRTKVLFVDKYDEKTLLSLFSKKIDSICKKHKVLFSSFLFVSEFDDLLMRNLDSLNYVKFSNVVTFYLDINWSTFEDYLKSLKSRMGKKIRREIKKCSDSGITIKEELISENIAETLSDLQANVSLKYNPTENYKLGSCFFTMLQKYARDKTRLFVARKDGKVVGFSLCLQHKEMLDVYMFGFDYETQTNDSFTYFNLCYYKPIQLAIDEKIKKIYFRCSADQARLNRGCKPEQTYSFIKCHSILLEPILNSLLRTRFYSILKERFLRDYYKNEI